MNTITKSDAVQLVKDYGYSASHPQTGGSISRKFASRDPQFFGDCSPKNGWVVEYLGER